MLEELADLRLNLARQLKLRRADLGLGHELIALRQCDVSACPPMLVVASHLSVVGHDSHAVGV